MRIAALAVGIAVAAASQPGAAQGPAVPLFALGGFESSEAVRISADHLEGQDRSQRRRLTFRSNVQVRQGELSLRADRLEAIYAAGSREPRSLTATGGVRIEEGSRRARCSEAHYDREARKLECRGEPAELWDGEDHLSGGVIRFDLADHRVTVDGEPRLEIHRDWLPDTGLEHADPAAEAPPGALSLRSERLEARERNGAREIHFEGDVAATRGALELRADELRLEFAPGAEQPERLLARGDVHAREGDREARCAEAEYRPGSRTLACSGGARLRDGADRLASEGLLLDLGSRRVEATGGALLRMDGPGRAS